MALSTRERAGGAHGALALIFLFYVSRRMLEVWEEVDLGVGIGSESRLIFDMHSSTSAVEPEHFPR